MTENDLPSPNENTLWESGWQGHESAQLQRMARLTLEQKIRWLQSAPEFVIKMQQSRQKKNPQPPEQ